ncbi:sterol desaturase family protein [Halopseudomonas sp.]|uniref:sterol desaturase family protein n=1 Tax=Halopseudomonas sp. TaxID=2901191 RepID=UPI00311E7504
MPESGEFSDDGIDQNLRAVLKWVLRHQRRTFRIVVTLKGTFMTLISYFVILFAFCVVFSLEVIAPASGASCDKRWMRLAGALNMVQIGFTLGAGVLFHEWFIAHSLLPLPAEWPAVVVGVICFFTASFIAYWWHRAMHKSNFLWRVFHQLHHSPSRIEALTSFYMHPLDGVAATFISSLCSYLIYGATAEAAAWAILFAALYNLYIHADKKSPYWLGYIVSRPEMHRVHHKLGYHASNYGLPLWDLLFGTWENPRERVTRCGFEGDRETRIYDMLKTRDVNVD